MHLTKGLCFIEQYCAIYKNLFPEIRSYECFKCLHLGMISKLQRKSLPAIARAAGMNNSQQLHHFLANSPWSVAKVRERRIQLLKSALDNREMIVCIDETGDKKKGNKTDYVARQYITNLGKTENGIVSVNAYGVFGFVTFPLIFKVYKPVSRLKEKDVYKTKPQLAIEIINELIAMGLKFQIVLADSLYGESRDFIEYLNHHQLKFVVAIRNNHGVLLPFGQPMSFNKWKKFTPMMTSQAGITTYHIREIIFGKRRGIKYWQVTSAPEELPEKYTWFLMTNLSGDIQKAINNTYSLLTWLEHGFKQIQDKLGWADHRLTEYPAIEKWWEMVFSTYFLLALQSSFPQESQQENFPEPPSSQLDRDRLALPPLIQAL